MRRWAGAPSLATVMATSRLARASVPSADSGKARDAVGAANNSRPASRQLIQRIGAAETNKAQAVWSGLVRRDPAFAAAWQRLSEGFGIRVEGEASTPWTRVDNCTADDAPAAQVAHFQRHISGRYAAAGPSGPP